MYNIFFFIKDLLKNNIQFNQTLTLILILTIGISFFGLNITYFESFIVFSTFIFTDFIINYFKTGKFSFPYSWVNAWFWITFFLRTDYILIYIFAWLLAIFSKHFFLTEKWKHFFNPSNFWVFLTLVLFTWFARTNPLQWWHYVDSIYYYLILLLIIVLGVRMQLKCRSILWKSNFPVIISFFLSSILMFFLFAQESYNAALSFFTWSFFIFIFFMITDPKTVPDNFLNKILFWIWITFSFYILQYFINENYSILWWLFLMTTLLPFIWHYESKEKFLNKTKFTFSNKFLLSFLIILLSLIFILFYYNWIPDLVFANRCVQLMCY